MVFINTEIEYCRKRLIISDSETVLQIGKGCEAVSISFPTEDEAIEYLKEQEKNLWN